MSFRDLKFLLAIGYCFLVVSIFLPVATQFALLITGASPLPINAVRIYHWSFMHIQDVLDAVSGNWVLSHRQQLIFFDYWNWWGPGTSGVLPQSYLIPMLTFQVATVFLGLLTLLRSRKTLSTLPLLFSLVVLNSLYLYAVGLLHATVSVGFWLSIVGTILIATPLAYKAKQLFIKYAYITMSLLSRTLISLYCGIWSLFWFATWYLRNAPLDVLHWETLPSIMSLLLPAALLLASSAFFLIRTRYAHAFIVSALLVKVGLNVYLFMKIYPRYNVGHFLVVLDTFVNALLIIYITIISLQEGLHRVKA